MNVGSLSLDDFLRLRSTDRRLARLTHDLGLPKARGLEFGPAANPTPLPEGVQVAYVDHARDVHADVKGAVPIDYAWAGSGSLAAVLDEGDYDYAIAAQVAQYVPNILGWFRGIHAVLRQGGVLNLSLPDKCFMFDAVRSNSTLAELVEADLAALVRPSLRQMFAHSYEARAIEPAQIWAGEDPKNAARLCGEVALDLAYIQTVEASKSGSYADCHCWVFTPASFLEIIKEATQLGLFPFVLNQISMTEPNGFEFYVSMRRDTQEEPRALREIQLGAIGHLQSIVERQQRTAKLLTRN